MDYEIRKRAALFSEYICSELKGAIVAHGFSQGQVADGINRQKANLSRWLNAKPVIPIDVAHEICDFIGADLQELSLRAEHRVIDELGTYDDGSPIITIDDLTEEQKKQIVLEKLHQNDQSLAANRDENKEAESEYIADAGA